MHMIRKVMSVGIELSQLSMHQCKSIHLSSFHEWKWKYNDNNNKLISKRCFIYKKKAESNEFQRIENQQSCKFVWCHHVWVKQFIFNAGCRSKIMNKSRPSYFFGCIKPLLNGILCFIFCWTSWCVQFWQKCSCFFFFIWLVHTCIL